MKELSDALIPTLRLLRQTEFYREPRFHASVAWALTSSAPSDSNAASERKDDLSSTLPVTKSQTTPNAKMVDEASQRQSQNFETIKKFPDELINCLINEFGKELTTSTVGTILVDTLCVRIGKEVSRWTLAN